MDRFLPPYPYGALSDMLRYSGIGKGWVLDPVGNQPLSAIELAQAGYQVFVACNNPILGKILQVICAAHPLSLYQAAIADFGALKRGQDRLENQIKAFYISPCPDCLSDQTDVRYLWKKNQTTPFARELSCKNCGVNGIYKISDVDRENLNQVGNIQLHQAKVLQRIFPGSTDTPIAVKEVIDSYLPRSLAVISSVINKLESLPTTNERKDILEALLVHVFDYGNMLWGVASSRNRPKQISVPAEFYEFNLWNILENAVSRIRIIDNSIPFTFYPDLPPESGGICFYPGRISSFKDIEKLPEFQVVATVLPRPNQALWTYNAVWSGWIWGHEAAQKLKGALERRRYDWIWHTQAIRTVFAYTSNLKIPFLAVAPELSNSFILAYLSAASSSNFQLKNAAYHPEQKSGQFYWYPKSSTMDMVLNHKLSKNVKKYLEIKSESADYQELMSIFLISETIDQRESFQLEKFENSLFIQTQKLFDETISDKGNFIQVDEDQLENAEFWLKIPPNIYQPVSDQVEGNLIRFVQKNISFTFEEVAYFINLNLPGLLPVSNIFLQRLISSYCELQSEGPNRYKLNTQEFIQARKNDIQQISKLIHAIGIKLGFTVNGDHPINWVSDQLDPNYKFFITASSIISQFKSKIEPDSFETVIVFPGSRAELLSYKIKNDPVYRQNFEKFHFVKFRHLRAISENPGMNFKTWVQILDSDPAVWQEANQP
ncbi:MAG: hypothetical protein IH585_03320, partial [Anaerolineaceae bacterium]|nr:hypothetical protein [Anaerolineaceae bacterium]